MNLPPPLCRTPRALLPMARRRTAEVRACPRALGARPNMDLGPRAGSLGVCLPYHIQLVPLLTRNPTPRRYCAPAVDRPAKTASTNPSCSRFTTKWPTLTTPSLASVRCHEVFLQQLHPFPPPPLPSTPARARPATRAAVRRRVFGARVPVNQRLTPRHTHCPVLRVFALVCVCVGCPPVAQVDSRRARMT